MKPITPGERLAAAAVLGLIEPRDSDAVRDRVRTDPSVAPLVREMRQTMGALLVWQKHLGSLPPPVLPEVRRATVLWIGLAAAAAVVLAAGALVAVHVWGGAGASAGLSAELAWAGAAVEALPGMRELQVPAHAAPPLTGAGGGPRGGGTFGAPPGAGMVGGPPAGRPRGGTSIGGGQGGKAGAAPPPAPPVKPEVAAFARQFAFAFRVPDQLPGGYSLAAGTPAAADRLRLSYRLADAELAVFLARSKGPDTAFEPRAVHGRMLTAGRRRGVLLAFDGPLPEKTTPAALADLFLAARPAPTGKN